MSAPFTSTRPATPRNDAADRYSPLIADAFQRGLTERLATPILDSGVPYLPGIANAGDIMRGLDLGLTHFKFFPAEASGGLKALKALAAPFHQCRFCPTGGITEASAPEWLAFDPVLCVGGSWVTGGSMAEVEARARVASGLR